MRKLLKASLKKLYYSKRFNRIAARAYRRIHPPPYLRPRMEFDYDVWNGICTFYGTDGRQIGENNTRPEVYREVVETKSKRCKFEGSRYGLPINLTALSGVMPEWDNALQLVTTIRQRYIAKRRLDHSRLNLLEGYVLSKMGAGYVAYVVRRKGSTYAATPPLETAFFTLGVGPFMVVRALLEHGDLTPLSPEPMSGERLFELADGSGALVSGLSGFGCAGAKRLIVEFLDATMNGTYEGELSSGEVRRMLDAIDDWDRFYAYVYASSRLELLVKVAQCLCAQTFLGLRSRTDPPPNTGVAELVQRTLSGCYLSPKTDLDDRTVLANGMKVLLALLSELDDEASRRVLIEADLLDGDGGTLALGDLSDRAAARRLRRIGAALSPRCQEELDLTNQALERFQDSRISDDDVLERSCGSAVRQLLRELEA